MPDHVDDTLNDLETIKGKQNFTPFEVYIIRRFDDLKATIKEQNNKIDDLKQDYEAKVKGFELREIANQEKCKECSKNLDNRDKDLKDRVKSLEDQHTEEKGEKKTFLSIGNIVWAIIIIVITALINVGVALLFNL